MINASGLFGTLKAKYFHPATPDSIDAVESGLPDYVLYYNHERLKFGLQGLSMAKYRRKNTACSAES